MNVKDIAKASACIMLSTLMFGLLIIKQTHAAPVLTADTSRPESSTFAAGETVTLTFSASGLSPNVAEKLTVTVKNESGTSVGQWQSPVVGNTAGDWQATWKAPSAKLGFYRVLASLSDGTAVSPLGSRPAGYITYCVVPNPSLRSTPTEANARFGMQGGFNADVNVLPYLGIRWVLENYNWNQLEPSAPGQFATALAAASAKGQIYPGKNVSTDFVTYNGQPWQIYTIAEMNGVPSWAANSDGSIKASDLGAWASFCRAAAADYASVYSNQPKHYYQLTWEPDAHNITNSEILSIYSSAYLALHEGDSEAMVLGPTSYSIFPGQIATMQALSGLGLNNYIDGFSIHPYFTQVSGQYAVQFPENVPTMGGGPPGNLIKNVRTLDLSFEGKQLCGTEQGFITDPLGDTTGGEDNELEQAESLLRENLIMLGEGYQFNMAFYIADGAPSLNEVWGYYYNLTPAMLAGASKISPKPIVPAYAAQSFLLEGSKSDGPVPNLGSNQYGYVFQNGSTYTLALWSNTAGTQTMSLNVGTNSVNEYDWMGNESTVTGSNDVVTLTIGPKPIYVTGATSAVL